MTHPPQNLTSTSLTGTKALWLLLLLALLLGTTFFVYTPGLSGPFVLDDRANIPDAAFNELTWSEVGLKTRATGLLGGFSRSLTLFSFGLTQYFSGYHAWAFKYQNLMLHLANGLLVFWFVALLVRAMPVRPPTAASHNPYWPALLVAALWLLHPLQVSTVLYAVQRLVLMSAFFSMLAAVCYLEGRLLMARRPGLGLAVAVMGLAVFWPLAVLSKENAVLLAPALLLVEWLVLRGHRATGAERRLAWPLVLVALVLPLVIGVVYLLWSHAAIIGNFGNRDFNLAERLLTEIHVMWLYLKLILFPVPAGMSFYHDAFPVQRGWDWPTAIAAAGLAALVLGAWLMRRRAPLVAFGILWFFCWHAMESTVFNLELVFEHRNYLALMGLMLALVAVMSPLWGTEKLRRALGIGAAALVVLLAFNTFARAQTWSNRALLAQVAYATTPNSVRATEEMFIMAHVAQDPAAIAYFLQRMRELSPNNAAPVIQGVTSACAQPSIQPELLDNALALAGSGDIDAATVNATLGLYKIANRGACPTLPADFLMELSSALLANPNMGRRSTRYLAAINLYGALQNSNDNIAGARTAFREALGLALTMSPSRTRQVAETIVDVALTQPDWDAAQAFVDAVTEGLEPELERVGALQAFVLPKPVAPEATTENPR